MGPTSRMSTISRSPGSAPSTAIGPLSTCTVDSGASRTSSAESSLWIAPSNHSRQWTRKLSPRPHGDLGRDVRVPPVVAPVLLVGELLAGVEGKDDVGHGLPPDLGAGWDGGSSVGASPPPVGGRVGGLPRAR